MQTDLIICFSLGYNFDSELIERVAELNSKINNGRCINEFFAALPDSPLLSTRPNHRIPKISWKEFSSQIMKINKYKINFNYLLNAKTEIKDIDTLKITAFVERLYDIGISHLIVYSPQLCSLIKSINDNFSITISSVYNIRSEEQVDIAYNSGADFIYIDSIFTNRDFGLLRKLRNHSKVPLKLYANVSCLSQCINKDLHYSVLSNADNDYQVKMNDELFNFCSEQKLKNPVKWLQMQWIRPEDIDVYVAEGFNHFKLTDRLASTKNLLYIAEYYLKGQSPQDLFPLLERNGTKFRNFEAYKKGIQPLFLDNTKIPKDFIEHYKSGVCDSTNEKSDYCNQIAERAIKISSNFKKQIKNNALEASHELAPEIH